MNGRVGSGRPWVAVFEGQGGRWLPARHHGDVAALVAGVPPPDAEASGIVLDTLPPPVAQTALVAHQVLGIGERIGADGPPVGAIGQSLGELAALVVAAALSLHQVLELVRRRAELAIEVTDGGGWTMVAVTRTPLARARAAAEAAGGWVVVLNAPSDVVVVVPSTGLDVFCATSGVDGATSRTLPVTSPFHTPLLAPAAAGLAPVLAAMDVATPVVPVVSAVGPSVLRTPADVRRSILAGLTAPVRWADALALSDGLWPNATWFDPGPSGALRRFVWKNGLDLDWRSLVAETHG